MEDHFNINLGPWKPSRKFSAPRHELEGRKEK